MQTRPPCGGSGSSADERRTLTSTYYDLTHADAVAAVHRDSPTFDVQRMDLELFMNKATREGSGIAFRASSVSRGSH